MNLRNMSYGTLLILVIICIIDDIENKFKNLFIKKQKKQYQYFSGMLTGVLPSIDGNMAREIKSTSDNIRYDHVSDTWEAFQVCSDDEQAELHRGLRGFWVIIDDSKKIAEFKRNFIEKIKSTPPVLNL